MLLEIYLLDAKPKAWALGNFALLAPFNEGFLLTLLNDKDKQAAKLGLLQILHTNSSSVIESFIIACLFTMSNYETQRCSSNHGCLLRAKGVISCTGRDSNYTTQIWNIHRPFVKCGCKHVGLGDFCKHGSILWFDHALWLMIHRVNEFFLADSLKSLC